MLHAIERLGMRAIEVPTHPADGIDIDALAEIIGRQPVAACMVMPNFQNPLGFQMPDARKKRLVDLLAAHGIPVIENDVYQELYFGDTPAVDAQELRHERPRAALRVVFEEPDGVVPDRLGDAGAVSRAGREAQVPRTR